MQIEMHIVLIFLGVMTLYSIFDRSVWARYILLLSLSIYYPAVPLIGELRFKGKLF